MNTNLKNAKRPCNYYHFKQCLAPCHLDIDKDAYKKTVDDVIEFLRGNNKSVRDGIEKKMMRAAQSEEYEVAAQYRDQVQALDNFIQKQAIAFEKIDQCDAIGIDTSGDKASIHVINVRDHIISGRDNFILDIPYEDNPESLLFEFILQYYENKFIPSTIYTSHALDEKDILAEAIRTSPGSTGSSKVKISSGHSKEENQLIAISLKNASYDLEQEKRRIKKGVYLA